MSEQTAAPACLVNEPDSLLDEIVNITSLNANTQAFSVMRQGVQALIKNLVQREDEAVRISGDLVDVMIGELDKQMSEQVDEILHAGEFQRLENAWRGLRFLVDRTDFRENTRIEIVNLSREDLIDDFEDSPEIVKSGLYQLVYTSEYGQFGGQPYGSIIGNYYFDSNPQDISLLSSISSVAAMAHAPFISAADSNFFGVESWADLAGLKDLASIFEGPQYIKWNAFRASESARYTALTLPQFLLRLPYGANSQPCKLFNYSETVRDGEQDFCWGNTAFAFASRLADSFARYRWCHNIIGPQSGGTVDDLPLYQFQSMGEVKTKISTQVLISERREFELAEAGFISLSLRKSSDNAAFFSANSCQLPKHFGNSPEGREAELNYKLSTQLPYMMIMDRLAHYIKVLQREHIGAWREKQDLERELNKWIHQYVTEMDNPEAIVRSRRPLRFVDISVNDVEGEPGWYRVSMKARPHFKYMGASFTLSLTGRLDKE